MKPTLLLRQSIAMALPGLVLCAVSAHAATLLLDFESATVGATPPSGWSTVGVGASGSYVTTDVDGAGGSNGGSLDWTTTETTRPGVYLVNNGTAFSARQAFSGTFDFYIVESGNYSAANFILGDVQDGLSGNAGEFINVYLNEQQFSQRARVYDGANAILFNGDNNNAYAFRTNEWVSASFTWTPTSDTTGDFSVLLDSPSFTNAAMTVTNYTFDTEEVYFGFGTGDAPVRFDNISITGTAIPEPSVALLGGLGLLALMRRRR